MEEVTLVARLTLGKAYGLIKKLNRAKKYVEEYHNIRLSLVVACSNDGTNVIYIGDSAIYVGDDVEVSELVDKVVESLRSRSSVPEDRIAVGMLMD